MNVSTYAAPAEIDMQLFMQRKYLLPALKSLSKCRTVLSPT